MEDLESTVPGGPWVNGACLNGLSQVKKAACFVSSQKFYFYFALLSLGVGISSCSFLQCFETTDWDSRASLIGDLALV